MTMKHGPWHELTVSWTDREDGEIFAVMETKPVPEDADPEWHLDFAHPAECGKSCHGCGIHPECGIDYDRMEIPAAELCGWGDSDMEPGVYRARHWFEVYNTWDGTEYSTGIETEKGSVKHDHITRDIKPRGECFACDLYCGSGQEPFKEIK